MDEQVLMGADWAPYVPFALQSLIMSVDEFYFHHRRELRGWEKLGHPADTLLFAACLAVLNFVEPSAIALNVYGALGALSCLVITKDEWQHKELCSGFENWLHALLFILHPVTLIWCGWLWWHGEAEFARRMMFGLTMGFFIYQLIYWNVWRRDRQRIL